MFNIGMDILIDSLYETLALFPYLFLTYLALEFLEHKTSRKTLSYIKKSGSYGPVAGGLLGLIPQCGFRSRQPTSMQQALLRSAR